MTETPARKPRPRRTFSAFGDVRRMPSEYEIVTQGQNWTVRQNRAAAFEQNPSSVANLWFLTYRDNSPLRAENWDAFRDPDALTYKAYVNLQADAETEVAGVLEEYAAAGSDAALEAGSVALLGHRSTLRTLSGVDPGSGSSVRKLLGDMIFASLVTDSQSAIPLARLSQCMTFKSS